MDAVAKDCYLVLMVRAQTTPADADVATPSSGADVTTGTPTRRYLKSTGDDVFAVKLDDMEAFIADLGSFAQSMVEGIPAERKNAFIEDVAHLYIDTIAGIHRIEAERDEDNTAADSKVLPAVLAHEIAAMSHSRFCAVVRDQTDRLRASLTMFEIDVVEQEHQALQRAVKDEKPLKEALGKCDSKTDFNASWSILNGRFRKLEQFCGGLASVFPGTAQVESDFSIVKYKKDEHWACLTDLSLEGILHSKEYKKIECIRHLIDNK